MPPIVAATIVVIGILGLFYLDRHEGSRASQALWIPAMWLFLISSRPVSLWLGLTSNFNAVDATDAYVEGSPIDRAIFTFLMVAALAVLFARANKLGPLFRRNALIILFFLFCAVSIFWSDYPFVSFKRWTKAAIGDVAIVAIILTEVHPLTALKRMLTRLGFLLFPLSILYIKYYPHIGRRLTMSWTEEAVGVTTQKNQLGLDCMLFGVMFLWMFLSVYRERDDPSRRRRLLAYGTIIGMIIWLLIQCNSTTSITGLIAAAALIWLARPSRKAALVHALVFAVLAVPTAALFLDSGGDMVQALGKDPTLTGRTETWTLLLGLHTNPLVGTGFESFWLGPRLEYMRTALDHFPINEAHNGYLEVYLNLGWIGVFFIAALLVTGYKRVMGWFRQDPQTATLFLGFFLCTMFESFTEAAFRFMFPSWVFLLLVIMAASQPKLFQNVTQKAREPEGSVSSDELIDVAPATSPVHF